MTRINNELRRHPKFHELLVYQDGRIYDTNQDKFVNLIFNHQNSIPGPVAYWTTLGRTYTLNVLKILYETYVFEGEMTKEYKICLKDTSKPIHPTNLRKMKRFERQAHNIKPVAELDTWLGPDSVYM